MCDSSFTDQNQTEISLNFDENDVSLDDSTQNDNQNDNELNSIFNDIFNNCAQFESSQQYSDEFNTIIAGLDVANPEDFDIYFDVETINDSNDLLSQAIGDAIGDLNVEIVATNDTKSTKETVNVNNVNNTQQLSQPNTRSHRLSRSVSARERTDDKENTDCKRKQRAEYTKSLVISRNPKPKNENASYKPLLFLRGHCRYGNAHDSKTPIWDIKFKPSTKLSDDLKIAATCGGNIINIINIECGSILHRFVDGNHCEDFNCIAWNIFDVPLKSKMKTRELSMIVTGGSRREARKTFLWFINANNTNDFVKIVAHSNSINSVTFHPTKKNILYSCSWDHNIFLWNIDCSSFTSISNYRDIKITKLYEINCNNNRLLSIEVSLRYDAIIIAGESGLQLTKDLSTAALLNKLDKVKVSVRSVELPQTSKSKLIDGLAIINEKDNLFAFRYKQSIFIANLDKMMAQMKNKSKGSIKLEIVVELSYSNQLCDYFYFSIQSRLLACGDSNGRILLYAISDSMLNTMNYLKVEPKELLEWPNVNNPVIDGKPVIDPKRPKFINMTAISADLNYIMCGTSSNLLCIWKRCHFKIPKNCVKRVRLS